MLICASYTSAFGYGLLNYGNNPYGSYGGGGYGGELFSDFISTTRKMKINEFSNV